MRRRPLVLLLAAVAAVAVLVAVLLAAVRVLSAASRLPERGTTSERLPGLGHAIEIVFDSRGLAHVRCPHDQTLYFAQGYVHARDRMLQMELARRRAAGRLAEVFGADALPDDRIMRTLRVAATAQRQLAQLEPGVREALDAYAAGVNAALERFGRWIAPETWMLGYVPERWQPLDTLSICLELQLELSGAARAELRRANQVARLGSDRAADLWGWTPAEKESWIPTGAPSIQGPAPAELAIPAASGAAGSTWAVAGSRSASGLPLVASELQLPAQLPVPLYPIHLHGRQLHVAGLSLPGVPGVLVGHTDGVAWAVSTARLDDQDLYVLELDAARVRERIDGTWQPLRTVTERIGVLGRDEPELLKVRLSERGPIVSDSNRETIALSWSGLHGPSPVVAILGLGRASSVSEAVAAWEGVIGPSFNLVAADVAGHILHHVVGRVAERPRGGGRLPAPGQDSAWTWTGFLPLATNAHRLDPEDGFIAVADHDLFTEGDYPIRDRFVGEFAAPWRVRRLRSILSGVDVWDVESTLALFEDQVSERARTLLKIIAPDLGEHGGATARLLLDWDGTMSEQGLAPAAYARLLLELGQAISADEVQRFGLADPPFGPDEILRLLAGGIDESWWDDLGSTATESRADIMATVLSTMDEFRQRLNWGELHQVRYPHQLHRIALVGGAMDRLFSRGPFPVGGDDSTVNGAPWRWREPFGARLAPAFRWVAAVGDWDSTVVLLPVGLSGRPWSSHYADQVQAWRRGRAHRFVFSAAAVDAAARARLLLLPEGGESPR